MFLNVAFASNQSPPACTHFSQRSGQRRNSARKNAFSVFFHPVLDSAPDFSVGIEVFTTEAILQGTRGENLKEPGSDCRAAGA